MKITYLDSILAVRQKRVWSLSSQIENSHMVINPKVVSLKKKVSFSIEMQMANPMIPNAHYKAKEDLFSYFQFCMLPFPLYLIVYLPSYVLVII